MTTSRLAITVAALMTGTLLLSPRPAFAQGGISISNPANYISRRIMSMDTVSPYLNLLRFDRTGAGQLPNYHTLVRPELERREQARRQDVAINRLQRQADLSMQRTLRQRGASGLASTGHPTRFMNYLHYYPAPTMSSPAARR